MPIQHSVIPDFNSLNNYDVLVIPSMTVKFFETRGYTSIHEERHLALLNLLKNKNCRVIFVASTPVELDIIKYRLHIHSQVHDDPTTRSRLILLSADDSSVRPLTNKILDNDRLIDEIKNTIRDHNRAIMLSYICTPLDEELRNKVGISQWYGSSNTQHWGSKSGSRKTFLQSGVPMAEGINEPFYKAEDLYHHALTLKQKTGARRIILKVDDGAGGFGNVVLDFSTVTARDVTLDDVEEIVKRDVMALNIWPKFDLFEKELGVCGAIVEEMIDPKNADSVQTTPSVQLLINGLNQVEVLSSHEQVVRGCFYDGCRYPAAPEYFGTISHYAKAAGEALSRNGVRGFFGIDFLATKQDMDSDWDIIALEINLRLCATTFAYFTLLSAVDEKDVHKKHYLFLDETHLQQSYTIPQLHQKISSLGLEFSKKKGHGILFATLSLLSSTQEVSLMCIGDSVEEVDKLHSQFKLNFCRSEGTAQM
eukprot:TRINITY_DN706_c0_g1_i1.p1 TRINITY_DN706_c0_g1~~TRINITY_DN706_c0_g1_i1.p1  ORF type:complete len:479 (-),score=112.70 TRINITY_DN706_c0_g1_i1:59-1495(-)